MTVNDSKSIDEILLYQTEDGKTRIDVKLQGETVWLTQFQMAELFQKDKRTISEHIGNIYQEDELDQEATVRNFRTVQKEGDREVMRDLGLYNLDVIISVGYRVKSHRGTQFRIWATQRLRDYLIKGFALDDERLKQAGGGNYFDELLARIRDIRERDLLSHAGKISHQEAIEKAHAEYDKFRSLSADELSLVEQDFNKALEAVKQIEVNRDKEQA